MPAKRRTSPSWPSSDHFDGTRFHNPHNLDAKGFKDLARWMLTRRRGAWRDWTFNHHHPLPPARVGADALRVTFIGHSSVLLQFDGLNLLTDPVWSRRAGPAPWLGPRRRRSPGLRLEELPPIDAVLLSHNHYDHCDLPTLRQLAAGSAPKIFVPLGLGPLVRRAGFTDICEWDWWQSGRLGGLEVCCVPAQHFSARTPFDRNRTLWCGWDLRSASGSVLFLGDTGFGTHLEDIASRCGAPRLALLPVGAYAPEWFMGPVHMTPEQAIEAHAILRAKQSIGIHYGTFPLADDGELDPVHRLTKALERRRDLPPFWLLEPGEAREIAG